MTTHSSQAIDLQPAADALHAVVAGVRPQDLDRPTPCRDRSVAQLLGHLDALTLAFTASAQRAFGPLTDTNPDEQGWPRVLDGWQQRLPERIHRLAQAWADPEAWDGMTRAGGIELHARAMGQVALTELVLHGWDLATAIGYGYQPDGETMTVLLRHAREFNERGTPGLFGPAVPYRGPSDTFESVLARSGRDIRWTPQDARPTPQY